jgi:hypothetical protein
MISNPSKLIELIKSGEVKYHYSNERDEVVFTHGNDRWAVKPDQLSNETLLKLTTGSFI